MYPIGTPGKPWSDVEKSLWLKAQEKKRDYIDDVVTPLQALVANNSQIKIEQYGELQYANGNYPLFIVSPKTWQENKPSVLITGGVHGYETSGVLGALAFIQYHVDKYLPAFNVVVAPCVSPWGYETINRWNPDAVDPNRSFRKGSGSQEAQSLMNWLIEQGIEPVCHIDLHETTDSDNDEFRPALAARDGITQKNWNIPDGFYLVDDTTRPTAEFQAAIIASVEQVTHIAEADESGHLIGVPMHQKGVIYYDCKSLFLCAGMTDAAYVTTTEVYPDSDKTHPQQCIEAQVAAIRGGLDFLIR
jgi:hypothetical protein